MSRLDGAFDGQLFEGILEPPKTRVDDAVFEGCLFRKAQLAELQFVDCRFIDCRFEACDLRMVKLTDSVLNDAQFHNCSLMGINWTAARGMTFSVRFEGCRLDYGVFTGMRLHGLQARDCSLREVDFTEADLSGACFQGSELTRSVFRSARLTKADLTQTRGCFLDDTARCKETQVELDTALALLESRGLRVPALERGG